LTYQTTTLTMIAMFDAQIRRLFDAYPAIYLACHRRHIRDEQSGAVVTAHQASVLDHLDTQRLVTLSKLAEHLGIGRSAMSIQVNRLVKKGYMRRKTVPGDHRKVGLTLTEAGNRIKNENTVLDAALVREMFALMHKSELETALDGIERLAKYATILQRRRARRRNG
jgi:MarR family transcriptional regulator, organic hydroperoxide resistance regulator